MGHLTALNGMKSNLQNRALILVAEVLSHHGPDEAAGFPGGDGERASRAQVPARTRPPAAQGLEDT